MAQLAEKTAKTRAKQYKNLRTWNTWALRLKILPDFGAGHPGKRPQKTKKPGETQATLTNTQEEVAAASTLLLNLYSRN